MTLDCRFLKNPHWHDELRDKTGLDSSVSDFVASDPKFLEFIERVTQLLLFLLPSFKEEGKSSVEIDLVVLVGSIGPLLSRKQSQRSLQIQGGM